jgi:transglutaminase-like putative cysteine protease
LPNETLVFMLGSRYCETDKLCDFVCHHLTFGYQYARATRTAYEAYHERLGVCRDFAHLAVAFCRCMNIPARYVNGFLGDIGVPPDPAPMDYNAWFEVFLDGRWFTFDARHNIPRLGRITVARGRDATDIPLATSFGPHILKTFKVWTDEIEPAVLSGLARRIA